MQNGNTTAKVVGIIIATVVAGAFITVGVYLGIYGYSNPDPTSCWVIKDLQSAAKTKAGIIAKGAEMGVTPTEGYPIEMHKIYLAWFRWGFWSNVAISAIVLVLAALSMAKKPVAAMIGTISCGIYMTNSVIWLVFGAIWRYSLAGRTASGDHLIREEDISDDMWDKQLDLAAKSSGFQISSGRFLKIYLSIALWLVLLIVFGMAVSSVVMCCCDPRNASAQKNLDLEAS